MMRTPVCNLYDDPWNVVSRAITKAVTCGELGTRERGKRGTHWIFLALRDIREQ